jgi:SAM-dependent methyltransferase
MSDRFRARDLDPREHAEKLDQEFGFRVAEIEAELLARARERRPQGDVKTWGQALHGAQSWVGLSHQTLQTPYDELSLMCDHMRLPADALVVDLGAGYGRLGLVLKERFPDARFMGFEIVPERVSEGKRVLELMGCHKAELYCQDLTALDFVMPAADCFLVYDYGTLEHIRHTLKLVEGVGEHKRVQVIGRGETTRSLIQHSHPWLVHVGVVKHEEKFSVYSNDPLA